MSDELDEKRQEAISDLLILRVRGLSKKPCSECRSLVRLVLDALEIKGDVSATCRADILVWLLPRAVNDVRKRALQDLFPHKYRRNDPLYRAVAATELLEFETPRSEGQRQGMLDIRKQEKAQDPDSDRKHIPRYLAAAWLGIGRTGLKAKDDDQLFLAFIEEMLGYLLEPESREYLQDLIAQCEPPAPAVQPAAQAPAPAANGIAVPGPSARSVPSLVQDQLSRLASRVRRQLEHEQKENRFAEPLPIRLRWSRLEDSGLVDHPEVVKYYFGHAAASNAGVPETLEGVAALFHQQSSGRLVVLGDEGSGKSTLVTELALELIKMRGPGDPVPIIFQLGSWDHDVAFEDWLIAELAGAYDFLKVRRRGEKKILGAQLVEDGHILALLDGFDEIPDVLRQAVIARLNVTLLRPDKVVITSRVEEYVQAVTGESGQVLTGAEVVKLQDLSVDDVDRYLRGRSTTLAEDPSGSPTPWDPVILALGDDSRTAHLDMLLTHFATPLMLMLAKVAYSEGDPAELLDRSVFPTSHSVEERLLSGFVEARIGRASRRGDAGEFSCTSDEARYWLGFIATYLVAERSSGIAWWKLTKEFLASVMLPVLLAVILFSVGAGFGAIKLHIGWMINVAAVLVVTVGLVVVGSIAGLDEDPVHLDWKNIGPMLRLTFFEGEYYLPLKAFGFNGRLNMILALLCASGPAVIVNTISSAAGGITFFVGVMLIFYSMIASTPYSSTEIIDPQRLFMLDREAALKRAKAYLLVSFIPFGLLFVFTWNLSYLGAVAPLIGASLFMMNLTASGAFLAGNILLSTFGLLPKRSMSFLHYAHRRGVLRQFGGEYQFRHELLRDRLAYWFIYENTRHPRIAAGAVRQAAENLGPATPEKLS